MYIRDGFLIFNANGGKVVGLYRPVAELSTTTLPCDKNIALFTTVADT
jgi:hypothetical protein